MNKKKEVEKLKSDMEALVEKDKEHYIHLLVGQLAFEVDKAIIDQVLTEFIGPPSKHHIYSVKDLERIVTGQQYYTQILSGDSMLQEVTRKWNILQKRIGWDGLCFRRIKHLKDLRKRDAHPEFDPNFMQKLLDDNEIDDEYKGDCQCLLKMLKEVQKLDQ